MQQLLYGACLLKLCDLGFTSACLQADYERVVIDLKVLPCCSAALHPGLVLC